VRKQEYIHMHALLNLVRGHMEDHGHLSPGQLSECREIDTQPCNIHQAKQTHHDAVMTLATVLGELREETVPDPVVGRM